MSTKTTQELTVATVAADLNIHPATVRRYIADGLISARRVGPKLIRIRASDVEKFKDGLGGLA